MLKYEGIALVPMMASMGGDVRMSLTGTEKTRGGISIIQRVTRPFMAITVPLM